MIIFKRVPASVPVCVLAVCSRLCSAWSRSLTSSSKASCSLLLFLFSFFRRFWIRTEQGRRRSGRTDDTGGLVIKSFRYFWYFYTRLHLYLLLWDFVYYMSVWSPCFLAFLDLYIKRFEGLWRYCELGVFVVLLWFEWDIHFRVTGSKWGEYAPGSVD